MPGIVMFVVIGRKMKTQNLTQFMNHYKNE